VSAPDDEKKQGPSGRVRHDTGGRAVWEWAVESGRHAIESTSRLLKKLDIAGLGLAEDDEKKQKRDAGANPYGDDSPPAPRRGVDSAGSSKRGFDPYDNRAPPKRGASRPPPRPAAPRVTQPPREGRKPGLLSRLLGRKY